MIKWHPNKQQVQQVCTQKLAVIISRDYERILIGQPGDILARLEGSEYPAIEYDETRPFGTFLLGGEHDDTSWTEVVAYLHKAQEVFLSPMFKQTTMDLPQVHERKAWKILNDKFETGDPICQFVATRIWHKYWAIRGNRDRKASEEFLTWAQNFVYPFSTQYHVTAYPRRIDSKNPIFRKTRGLFVYDRMSLIYSLKKEPTECLFIEDSLVPIERFYKDKLEKWTKYIIQCRLCGKYFMADSLQHKLCSESCKQEAQKNTRESRKEDEGINKVDKAKATTNGRWDSRLRKMRKSPEWSEEEVSQYQLAMKQFQAEKRKMSSAYKKGRMAYGDFLNWLVQQQEEAERVFQEMRKKKE